MAHGQGLPPGGSQQAATDEAAVIVRTLSSLVEPLAAVLPGECEVILHDLRLLPGSIVAVAGNLTGSRVGGPATGLLQQSAARGALTTALGHSSRRPDGSLLRSSTLIFRDAAGIAVAALCISNETASWAMMAELARAMLPWTGSGLDQLGPDGDEHLRDVTDLARYLLARALAAVPVPVELMKKRHKVAVVRDLKERGFFTLRESVETAAQALGVTRFTVYNYLNELDHAGQASEPG